MTLRHDLARRRRLGRIYWATLTFLLGFAVLIWFVSHWYLLPAFEATRGATPLEKRQLAVQARLILAVVLFILVAGIMLTFRVGRFFFPRTGKPPKPTTYVDAWAEAGRRLDPP